MPLLPIRRWCARAGVPALLSVLAVVLGGCASGPRYDVKIDAAASPELMTGYSYALAPRNPARSNEARHERVIEHVHTALSQRGLYEAPDPAKADMIIDVDYGEHPPQSKVTTVSQPVVVQPDPFATSSSIPPPPGSYPTSRVDPITGQPRSQVVMVETQRITYTTEKYIRVTAVENRRNKPAGEQVGRIWAVEATLEDEASDFDAALPAMIDAAIEYIGVNTGGQVTVKVQAQ